MTDKQLGIVNEFLLQFQKMFYVQVLRLINNAPQSMTQSIVQNLKPFELHAEYKKQITLEINKSKSSD